MTNFDIFRESVAIFFPPQAPPTPNPMNLFAPVLFEFFGRRRRGGLGRGDGMAFMSRTAKHSDILHRRKGVKNLFKMEP